MKWTKIEIDKAIALIKDGNSYKAIGIILNRTEKSVKLKLNNFGLKISKFSRVKLYTKVNCSVCDKEFEALISDKRKFCSSSCSAKHNNGNREFKSNFNLINNGLKRRKYNSRKNNKCLNCDDLTINKFCSFICQHEYKRKNIFSKIESGDKTLYKTNYKKYLIDKYGDKCMECGWNKINPITNKVPIELEHIDGNSENNSLDNLKLLCPNCHSLTPTYKALNIGNGRHKRMERYKDGKSY